MRKAVLAGIASCCCAAAAQAAPSMIVLSSATYHTPGADSAASGVALDPAGSVFLTGTIATPGVTDNFLSQKYTKGLVLLPLAQQLYTNGRTGNIANGIALDGLGNVLVAGEETNLAGNKDFVTLKYSPDFAALLSSSVYDGGGYDSGAAVRADSQNNIFVTGYTNEVGNKNVYTIKYSAAMVKLSTASYDGSGLADQGAAITSDGGDNLIVAGFTQAATNNVLVLKYDNNLKKLAEATLDSGGDDRGVGVAVDSAGRIVVAARQAANILVLKYDGTLTTLLSSAVYAGASPLGLALDSADNIVVAGYTGPLANPDFFTVKFAPDLAVVSTAAYNGGNADQINAVAVDPEDNPVVAGQTSNGTNFDYFVIKYSASPKLTDVSPLYIGETSNVTLTGRGLLADTAVSFADAGISTGAATFNAGQITVAVTPSASVILGVTTITVTNVNGEAFTSYTLPRTRLRQTIPAGQPASITAMTRLGQVSITVQAGSFLQQETIILAPEPAAPGDIQQVGEGLSITGPSTSSLVNMSITLRYDPALLGTYPETQLSLGYYDTSAGWVTLPSAVNTSAKTVTAAAKAANNKYAVIKAVSSGGGGGGGIGGPGGGSGIPAKVYPNPYRPGSGGNFDQSDLGDGVVFAGLGAGQSFKLTIVDLAGRLVFQKSAAADANGKYLWDTKTASGGKAATGVYIYFIKGSGTPLKGKFSIIR